MLFTKFFYQRILFCALFSLSLGAQTAVIKIKKEKFIPASFPGGDKAIKDHFDKAIGVNISRRLLSGDKVEFNAQVEINEKGQVSNVQLLRGSTQAFIDSIYINAVLQMPLWNPAMNQNGANVEDKQFVSFTPRRLGFRTIGVAAVENCNATKEDFNRSTKIVGIIEDKIYVDSLKTGIVLCRIVLADKREYRDIKALVVVQQCNWNTYDRQSFARDVIPGCYNCDMFVLNEKPERFKDVTWIKYKNSGYKKFYLVDDRHSVVDAVSH